MHFFPVIESQDSYNKIYFIEFKEKSLNGWIAWIQVDIFPLQKYVLKVQ